LGHARRRLRLAAPGRGSEMAQTRGGGVCCRNSWALLVDRQLLLLPAHTQTPLRRRRPQATTRTPHARRPTCLCIGPRARIASRPPCRRPPRRPSQAPFAMSEPSGIPRRIIKETQKMMEEPVPGVRCMVKPHNPCVLPARGSAQGSPRFRRHFDVVLAGPVGTPFEGAPRAARTDSPVRSLDSGIPLVPQLARSQSAVCAPPLQTLTPGLVQTRTLTSASWGLARACN
jgi:hypothetical protein